MSSYKQLSNQRSPLLCDGASENSPSPPSPPDQPKDPSTLQSAQDTVIAAPPSPPTLTHDQRSCDRPNSTPQRKDPMPLLLLLCLRTQSLNRLTPGSGEKGVSLVSASEGTMQAQATRVLLKSKEQYRLYGLGCYTIR